MLIVSGISIRFKSIVSGIPGMSRCTPLVERNTLLNASMSNQPVLHCLDQSFFNALSGDLICLVQVVFGRWMAPMLALVSWWQREWNPYKMRCQAQLYVLCLLVALPVAAHALDYTYTSSDGKITLTRYTGEGGAVSIPSQIDGLPVVGIGSSAFKGHEKLTNVTVPASVTSIGVGTFESCKALISLFFMGNAPTFGHNVCTSGGANKTVYSLEGATGWDRVTVAGVPKFKVLSQEAMAKILSNGGIIAPHPGAEPALQEPLMKAAQEGDLERIKELLEAGANPHVHNYRRGTAFRAAALGRHFEAAELMLDRAGIKSVPDDEGFFTPLMVASMMGRTNLIAKILKQGADVNETRQGGKTALLFAAQVGHNDAVRMLLEHGADADVKSGLDDWTALDSAKFTHKLDTVALLLDHGADMGQNPLVIPAIHGSIDMLELLVSRGADVNQRYRAHMAVGLNKDDESVIHAAANAHQAKVVQWLVDHGASVEEPGYQLSTPLIYAVKAASPTPARLNTVQKLIDCGANVNTANRLTMTPLMYAARTRDTELIQLLVNNGAKVDAMTGSGISALDWAAEWESADSMKALIKAGAKPNPNTLLQSASESSASLDKGKSMQVLLDAGADVNGTNGYGETALMCAVKAGRRDNVKWLLSKGADVNMRDIKGKKAADFTQDRKMLKLLK